MAIEDKELKKLLSKEYLKSFDTVMAALEKEANIMGYRFSCNPTFLDSEIIEKRQKAMLMSYYKYGHVYANYIRDNLMQPLGDIIIRADKYTKTHNLEYLVDLINFAMLAYWKKTTSAVTLVDMPVLCEMIYEALYEEVDFLDSMKELVALYKEEEDVGYLVVIAVIAKYELQYPVYFDAEYRGTDNETEIAGYCYNDIAKHKGEW